MNAVMLVLLAALLQPVPLHSWLDLRSFADYCPLSMSTDGRSMAFTLNQNSRRPATLREETSGVPFYAPGCDVWILDIATGVQTNLTGGKGDNWLGTMSPDGRTVAFFSDRESAAGRPEARLWVWERQSNRLRVLPGVLPHSFTALVWTPDSARVIFKALPAGTTRQQYAAALGVGKKPPAGTPASTVVFEYDPSHQAARQGTTTNLDRMQSDLVAVDVRSGEVRRLLAHQRINTFSVSPRGDRVAILQPTGFLHPGSSQVLGSVVLVEGGQARVLAHDVPADLDRTRLTWSPAGDRLAYKETGYFDIDGGPQGDVFVVDAATGMVRKVSSGPHPSFLSDSGAPLWSADGSTLYWTGAGQMWKARVDGASMAALGQLPGGRLQSVHGSMLWSPDGGHSTVVNTRTTFGSAFTQVDLATGALRSLLDENRRDGDPTLVWPDGQHLTYLSQSASDYPDLWVLDVPHANSHRLTHTNAPLDEIAMGTGRTIDWQAADGTLLHGALLLPAGYQEGHRYPVIAEVYGGQNQSHYLNVFGGAFGLSQVLATRGYAVLMPDAPWHGGTPLADSAAAILPGLDKLVAMGIADPDRLGVYGESNGGYTVLSLLVQTTRFKAAVASASMGDLFSYYGGLNPDGTAYGLQDVETGLKGMGGTPWQQRERYLQNSPYFFLDKVTTPLLLTQGELDIAGHPSQPEEFFVGLRRLGQTVTYVKYLGEGHDWGHYSAASQLDYLGRVVGWYDRYLK